MVRREMRASRLDELVMAAHEGLVDAELAIGRHVEVVVSLQRPGRAHPVRERFHAQLVLALYRCGRQAEALRAYRDAREDLAEELGLEPGPELRALERAVLAHDPALAAPVTLASIDNHLRCPPRSRPSSGAPPSWPTSGADGVAAARDGRRPGRWRRKDAARPGGRCRRGGPRGLVRRARSIGDGVAVAEAVGIGVGAPERAPT